MTAPAVCKLWCCEAVHITRRTRHMTCSQGLIGLQVDGLMVKHFYEPFCEYGEELQMYEHMYITEIETFI